MNVIWEILGREIHDNGGQEVSGNEVRPTGEMMVNCEL